MALKKWRKATSIKLWSACGVEHPNEVPESLLMPNSCLMSLSKSGCLLQDYDALIDFLKPWCGVNRHASKILACLKSSSAFLPGETEADNLKPVLPSKAERKAMLKTLRESKKLGNLDNPAVANASRMTALRDQWLLERGKPSAKTKARLKKAATAAKKEKEKQDKARERS